MATAAAEEADDGPGGWRLCSVIYLSTIFFLPVTTTNTESQGGGTVSSHKAHPGRVILVGVVDAPPLASMSASLSLL